MMLNLTVKSALASARRAQGALWSGLWRIALPNHCTLCGNLSQQRVCGACDTTPNENSVRRCPCCAAAFEPGLEQGLESAQRCGACLASPPAFDASWVVADYAAPLDALAQALKFSAQPGLARWFADKLAAHAHLARLEIDCIIPVPLSPERLAARGYNQSWEIARPLARQLRVPAASGYLQRLRDTAPQTEINDARQRRHNVRGAFALNARSAHHSAQGLSGLHIAVVDDVMTSGATLAEIAGVLKRAGVARVTNLVALRTPPPQTRYVTASQHGHPHSLKH